MNFIDFVEQLINFNDHYIVFSTNCVSYLYYYQNLTRRNKTNLCI